MGTKLQQTRPLNREKDGNALVSWVHQQIETGNFTSLSTWLKKFDFELHGRNQSYEIQQSAIQLCQICKNHQEEMEASWAAYQRAVAQEKALSANLTNIVTLLVEETDTNQPIAPEMMATANERPFSITPSTQSAEPPKLWQKIQKYIGLAKDPPSPEDAPPIDKLETKPIIEEEPTEKVERPLITIYCFGSFRVFIKGHLVNNWKGNKSKSIFKYLLLNPGLVHRERLMNFFWQDEEPEVARRNLYQTIYVLRQALKKDSDLDNIILCENSAYQINPEIAVWVDSASFSKHYEIGKEYLSSGETEKAIHEFEAADTLYEGDYLPEDLYDEWLLTPREDFRYMYLDILDQLSQIYEKRQKYALTISYTRKILREDNCREDAHRRLMRAYYNLGQRNLAIRQYHLCLEALQQELAVEPMPATTDLFLQIQGNGAHLQKNENLSFS